MVSHSRLCGALVLAVTTSLALLGCSESAGPQAQAGASNAGTTSGSAGSSAGGTAGGAVGLSGAAGSNAGAGGNAGSSGAATQGGGATASCAPKCETFACGDDGCGAPCGVCAPNELCQAHECRAMTGGADAIVDTASVTNEIHPEIYGVALASKQNLADSGATLNRWGGNAATRYNWQNGVTNTASDWFFENALAS